MNANYVGDILWARLTYCKRKMSLKDVHADKHRYLKECIDFLVKSLLIAASWPLLLVSGAVQGENPSNEYVLGGPEGPPGALQWDSRVRVTPSHNKR